MQETTTSTRVSKEQRDAFRRAWTAPKGVIGWFRIVNNIPIAHRYMAMAFLFFLVGGVQALLLRVQLGTPENTFLDPATYNQIFTMHGTTMMFLFVIPFLEAIANYLLPLLLGARDLPYPRLASLAFWTFTFGGIFLYASFLFGVAPDGGWFAYVPLTGKEYSPGINMDWWDIGLSVAEIAAMGAAAELIVSILRMRAPGMSLMRMPIYAWSMLVTGFMILFAFTPLVVATAFLEVDRVGLTSFFVPEAGGEPLLWQHLFWFFGHPDVYIMFVPAVGIASHIVQTFARRPLVGYPLVVFAIISMGFFSFGLWVHHMFTTGIAPVAMGFFTAASMMIMIPSGIHVFSWIATLWTGTPVWRTPLLFVAGFIVIFTLGGLTGVMVAAVPFDQQVHDSYFIVAHFHYVLVGGVIFPIIAGLYYWLPKITGRMLNERLGRWNFWIMFVFFNITFFPMHIAGMRGMPRRIFTYPADLGWDVPNLISTIGSFGLGLGVLLFLINFGVYGLWRGQRTGRDPWRGDTLEWANDSPPEAAQFPEAPVVRSRHPLWEQDSLEADEPALRRKLETIAWRPTEWRGALVTTVLDAKPQAVVHMPGPTIWPLIMAIGFLFLFAAALLHNMVTFVIGAVLTAVSIGGWFFPRSSEQRAIEEISTQPSEALLPLAVAGPSANGWWGTIVFCGVLATALTTVISSYFYLGDASTPAPSSDRLWPALAAVAATACAALCMRLAGGARPTTATRPSRIALIGSIGFTIAGVAFFTVAWRDFGLDAAASAIGSSVLGIIAFQWIVNAIFIVMAVMALAWAFWRNADPRGHGVMANATLVSYFAVISAATILFTLYLTPVLW